MFWSQIDENSINDLLNKEDITLEEVLDHDSLLQECKIQNDKLVKFLCLKTNFIKLLNYVLITPSEDIEEKERFKYPSLVCEVLTSDLNEINDLLINGFQNDSNETLTISLFIDLFIDNLEKEKSMNPLTISYSVKILLNILKYNNDKVMGDILKKDDSLSFFLKHLDNNAIAVFFTELLMCEDEFAAARIKWLKRDDFFLKCVLLFDLINDNRNNSVETLLCEVIGASCKCFANREIRTEIRSQLNNKAFLDLIFTHLSNPKAESSLITGCLKVLRAIVDFEIESEDQKMDSLKEMILNHFFTVIMLLSNPPKQIYDPMPTTIGKIIPFGTTRLEIIYLLESLLKLKDSEINTGIGQTNVFMVLMAFVSQYKWNTMFQLGLLRIFDILFADLSTNCQYRSLIELLVTDCDIYHWFMTVIDETATESSNPRPGSMGMLWKVGNHLNTLWISKIAEDLIIKETEESDRWTKVVNKHLNPRNDRNIIIPPKIDNCFKDIKIVDIDEDAMMTGNNPDLISDFFRNKSGNMDEIFGAVSNVDDSDDWIENELSMPNAPVDDFCAPSESTYRQHESQHFEDDSSSDDEESPSIIKQRTVGNAAKYLLSEVPLPSNGDLLLFDVPAFQDEELSCLTFDNPWKTNSKESSNIREDWAKFNM